MPRPLRVLYVDDDEDIRTIAGIALELDPAIEVRLADGANTALAVIGEGWLPDIALLDVRMPGEDGFTLLERLRALPETRRLPVAFVTASAHAEETRRCEASGAVAIIVKPFDPLQLAASVRSALEDG